MRRVAHAVELRTCEAWANSAEVRRHVLRRQWKLWAGEELHEAAGKLGAHQNLLRDKDHVHQADALRSWVLKGVCEFPRRDLALPAGRRSGPTLRCAVRSEECQCPNRFRE